MLIHHCVDTGGHSHTMNGCIRVVIKEMNKKKQDMRCGKTNSSPPKELTVSYRLLPFYCVHAARATQHHCHARPARWPGPQFDGVTQRGEGQSPIPQPPLIQITVRNKSWMTTLPLKSWIMAGMDGLKVPPGFVSAVHMVDHVLEPCHLPDLAVVDCVGDADDRQGLPAAEGRSTPMKRARGVASMP
jgi:hypothetical protein